MESHTRALVEEQRNQVVSQAKFLILLQETKAEREVRLLNRKFRFQDMELSKQFQILAELRSRKEYFKNLASLHSKKCKN